ncbi:protein AMBP-like [Notolabrus celidotus]|uniref:protein AMBP-like n=1 Tax=Notolabrus celidotus TaxID=1203425 RepID=UPI001490352C|nr:protein AMBP-like [Notolabrus celidotus]
MQRAGRLFTLLVLGWAWTLKAVPVHPEPLIATQESFDVDQFMGRWHEVAVVSTCPHYMQRKRGRPAMIAMELQHNASEGNFTMTSTSFWNGSCEQTATGYRLTDTPGRFFHHVARFGADVDSFVVHTNYDDFAMILQLGEEKPMGIKTTSAKLYSRTMNVGSAVLENFKSLIRQHGMSDEVIIMNQSKGDCAPGEQVTMPIMTELQRSN